jgi:predicted transcriptional regulator
MAAVLPGKENFRIVRLAEGDVRCKSDHLADFRNLILGNERMYPEIGRWYSSKVLPGIRQEERVAFIGYLGEKPAVSAVVKKGADAKFCHLRIDEVLRGSNLGDIFFSLMALEIRDLAKHVYFTLPESVWSRSGAFFQSFGFESTRVAEAQYRLFDRELACAASFRTVWGSLLTKIPKLAHLYECGGFTPDSQLLMSVKPEFADRIMSGKKRVELRRKFSTRWIGHRINIYASAPVMSMVGEARICRIVVKKPELIWDEFQDVIGCDRVEFDAYSAGAEELYAIELEDVRPYRERVPLVQLEHLLDEDLTPPQSYVTLEKNRPWAKAVSITAYLHGCFKSTMSFGIDVTSFARARRAVPAAESTSEAARLVQPELRL